MQNPFASIFDVPGKPVIVFEDYYMSVVQKPYGYTVEKHTHYPSLEDFFTTHLKTAYPANKKQFAGIVHRIDVSTAGLVVIAKTPQALKNLNRQFELKTVVKKYIACVQGIVHPAEGRLEGFITEDKAAKKATFTLAMQPGAKASLLHYTTRESRENFSLLDIRLETGRFHQVRASFAFTGNPVVNDVHYGAETVMPEKKIMLLAASLEIAHPKTGEVHQYNIR